MYPKASVKFPLNLQLFDLIRSFFIYFIRVFSYIFFGSLFDERSC